MNNLASKLFLGSVVALAAAGASAQPFGVPMGKWWERPRVAARLGITPEQVSKLNAATYPHAKTMVDLKAAVDKATIDLQAASDAEPFEADRARAAFGALLGARQRLETERFEMLLKVKGILTADQWRQMQEFVRERRDETAEGAPQAPGAGPRRNPSKHLPN